MEDDIHYLNLISIFHFVVAGIAGLFACFPIIHLVIGITTFTEFPRMSSGDIFSPFALMPLMFILLPVIFIIIGWMFAIAIALAGYFIRKQQWHTYCLVMGGIETLFTPIGTVLGVFTIILLTKPKIKEMFIANENKAVLVNCPTPR